MASEMSPAAQAAADLVADAARLVEAPEEGEQPASVVEAEVPSYEADTTGIEELLEPEEVEEEPELVEEDDTAYDEYEEPDKLKARLVKLEKKNKWLEEQRVTQGRKQWLPEVKRRFPLADAEEIVQQATSKRQAMLKAKDSHDRTQRIVQPFLNQMKQTEQEQEAVVQEEQRAQESNAWGPPSTGPAQPLTEQASETAQLDRRNSSSVKEMALKRFRFDPRFKDGV